MLTRHSQPPLADETSQITALKDLLDFLQGTNLPPVPWNISPTAGPCVDALLAPGPSSLLKIIQAYAEAINVPTMLRRLNETTQEFVAYRPDALNGRTEMYVAVRTPINCLSEPPDELTPGTLIAEREWQTTALVEFERTAPVQSIKPTEFQYARGDQVVMHQWGFRGLAVGTKWFSSLDINDTLIVDDSAVKIIRLIEYVSPITPWEDEMTRKVELSEVTIDDETAQILTGPWRPLLGQE